MRLLSRVAERLYWMARYLERAEDTARLLRIRGEAMQEAVPVGMGAMAAIIGLEQDAVEKACADATEGDNACQIANDNGGGQLVISGHKEAVERAMAACSEAGAKRALPLPVSAPFHSTLMSKEESFWEFRIYSKFLSNTLE